MNIERIRTEIEQLLDLINGWSCAEIMPEIEREVALSKLSRLYEQIRFNSAIEPTEPIEEKPEEVIEEIADEVIEEEVDIVEHTIFDINTVSIDMEPEEEVISEEELEPKIEIEIQAEPEVEAEIKIEDKEPQAEKSEEEVAIKTPATENVLFDVDIIPKQSRQRRSTLMSLYQTEEPTTKVETDKFEEPKPAEPKIEEPAQTIETPSEETVEPTPTMSETEEDFEAKVPQTIGDAMAKHTKSIADQLAERQHASTYNERVRYRSFNDLGINERYLLSRELFGDDPQYCRQILDALEMFDNYDDAMIFIAERFNWSEESAGAKVILSILENKFNI